jgi:hypothetical protein
MHVSVRRPRTSVLLPFVLVGALLPVLAVDARAQVGASDDGLSALQDGLVFDFGSPAVGGGGAAQDGEIHKTFTLKERVIC